MKRNPRIFLWIAGVFALLAITLSLLAQDPNPPLTASPTGRQLINKRTVAQMRAFLGLDDTTISNLMVVIVEGVSDALYEQTVSSNGVAINIGSTNLNFLTGSNITVNVTSNGGRSDIRIDFSGSAVLGATNTAFLAGDCITIISNDIGVATISVNLDCLSNSIPAALTNLDTRGWTNYTHIEGNAPGLTNLNPFLALGSNNWFLSTNNPPFPMGSNQWFLATNVDGSAFMTLYYPSGTNAITTADSNGTLRVYSTNGTQVAEIGTTGVTISSGDNNGESNGFVRLAIVDQSAYSTLYPGRLVFDAADMLIKVGTTQSDTGAPEEIWGNYNYAESENTALHLYGPGGVWVHGNLRAYHNFYLAGETRSMSLHATGLVSAASVYTTNAALTNGIIYADAQALTNGNPPLLVGSNNWFLATNTPAATGDYIADTDGAGTNTLFYSVDKLVASMSDATLRDTEGNLAINWTSRSLVDTNEAALVWGIGGGVASPKFTGNGEGLTNLNPPVALGSNNWFLATNDTGGGTVQTNISWISVTNLASAELPLSVITNGGGLMTNGATFYGSAARMTNFGLFDGGSLYQKTPPLVINDWLSYWDTAYGGVPSQVEMMTNMALIRTNGMWDAGWQWYELDDNSTATNRVDGHLVAHPTKIPMGFPALADYAHTNGFKFAFYISSPGTNTCAGLAGTPMEYLYQDIRDVMTWGGDGIRVDSSCHGEGPGGDAVTDPAEMRELCRLINQAAADAGDWGSSNVPTRALVIDVGVTTYPALYLTNTLMPFEYAENANAVMIFGGVPNYSLANLVYQIRNLTFPYAWMIRPGHWVNLQGITKYQLDPSVTWGITNQMRMMMEVRCMGAAKMSLTSDFGATSYLLPWLTNQLFYSYYRDPGVICGRTVATNNLTEVWARPMGWNGSGTNLLCFINLNTAASNQTVTAGQIGLPSNVVYTLSDVWSGATVGTWSNAYTYANSATNVMTFLCRPTHTYGSFVGDGSGLTNLTVTGGSGATGMLTNQFTTNVVGFPIVNDVRFHAHVTLTNAQLGDGQTTPQFATPGNVHGAGFDFLYDEGNPFTYRMGLHQGGNNALYFAGVEQMQFSAPYSTNLALNITNGATPSLNLTTISGGEMALNVKGALTGVSAVQPQAVFNGYSDALGASADSGVIYVGRNWQYLGRLDYASSGNTVFYIDNTYDSPSAAIKLRVRTAGTPVEALTILGSGNVTAAATVGSALANSATPAFRSGVTNNAVLKCPDGGTWILKVGNDGTLSTVTNTAGL